MSLNVIIVGGGVSGLATAYSLGRVGHKITIIEGDKWLGEIGAGIQAAPSESFDCQQVSTTPVYSSSNVSLCQMYQGFSEDGAWKRNWKSWG